ncbi:MAG: hypothetical protein J3R72DRAFT_420951 [Linnemannia gamsii]|nr:MAG: hypothetical protein J3R72DRAFT_420951 [Linnemannia gamsii]
MSLPRFLRGLQKKPHTATLTPTTNDPNLSDSSSSSSSSGPKDAMGFPIPVSTVIMPTITSTITDRNNSVHNNSGDNNNRGQQQESSISSGPIDIITPHYHRLSATSTRSAASSAPSAASSFSTPSSIAVLTTTTTTSPSTGIQLTTTENRVRNNRSSRSSSVSSSAHSSSFRPPTVTVATNDDNDSNINKSGQLLSKSLPASSHLLSPFSSSTTTASPLPSTTILTSTMWTPMVNITSPSQSRPPQIIYPSAMIDSSVTSLLTATAPVSTTETSTEAVNKPTKTTMGFDIEVTYIEVQSDQDSNPVGGVDQLPAKKEQQFSGGEGVGGGPEAGGITGKTGRIRSNAIAQKQQLSHEKYSQEQPKTHTQESTSGVVDIEEPWPSSSRIHKGLDRDVTVATTTSTTTPAAAITTSAAVFQPGEGPRWSDSNFDLEHKAETLARDLVGAPVVQERATPGTTSTSFSISSSSSSSAAGSGSHSPSRPVSILKNSHPPQQQRPKSILRTRSGSHPLLPLSSSTTTSSRPVSFISVSEPHSPQHSPISTTFPSSITSAVAARLSMTSDTSTVSHSSSFLFQDPMEQPSTPVLGATNISVPAKNASRKSSTSAGAGTGTQSHRRTPAPRDVDNTRSALSASAPAGP